MKNRDTGKTWLRRIGYAAALVIAFIWIKNFVGLCKEANAAFKEHGSTCTVSSPLKVKHMKNGEIVFDMAGSELVRISTTEKYPDGYLEILYALDTTDGVTSEEVEIQGYCGQYYKVPVLRKTDNEMNTMNVSSIAGYTYYILLKNNSGEDCYMMGTALSKDKLLPLFDCITLREE